MAAIALHDRPGADALLEGFAASGAAGGAPASRRPSGWATPAGAAATRPCGAWCARTRAPFREHAVFALSQSEVPEAIDAILEVARPGPSRHVRGQALFWLAQKAGRAGRRTASPGAIEDDPDTEVKKKAVFALSQLPRDEGVPLLIEVARTNRNPAVRKQAMFWLGQSKDPRALAFFEEVLGR